MNKIFSSKLLVIQQVTITDTARQLAGLVRAVRGYWLSVELFGAKHIFNRETGIKTDGTLRILSEINSLPFDGLTAECYRSDFDELEYYNSDPGKLELSRYLLAHPEVILPTAGEVWQHYKGGYYAILGIATFLPSIATLDINLKSRQTARYSESSETVNVSVFENNFSFSSDLFMLPHLDSDQLHLFNCKSPYVIYAKDEIWARPIESFLGFTDSEQTQRRFNLFQKVSQYSGLQ